MNMVNKRGTIFFSQWINPRMHALVDFVISQETFIVSQLDIFYGIFIKVIVKVYKLTRLESVNCNKPN